MNTAKETCQQALRDLTRHAMRDGKSSATKWDDMEGKFILKAREQRQHDTLEKLIDQYFDLLGYAETIEKRLQHLLDSDIVRRYDEKNPFTGGYVRDINELDGNIESEKLITVLKKIKSKCITSNCSSCPLGTPSGCQIERLASYTSNSPDYWDMNEIERIVND